MHSPQAFRFACTGVFLKILFGFDVMIGQDAIFEKQNVHASNLIKYWIFHSKLGLFIAFCDKLGCNGLRMIIENRRVIDRFVAKHADARVSFAEWLQKVEAAQWTSLVDLKNTFNSADYLKGLVIFNVGGNKYRVLAEIVHNEQVVRIAKVGTHAEYNGWKL